MAARGSLAAAAVLSGLAALAALAALPTTAAAGGSLAVEPVPVPAGETATVTADFGEPVQDARVQACQAAGNETILSCFRSVAMDPAQGDNWTATVPQGATFGDVPKVGVNATGTRADGTAVHLPGDGAAYRFVAVAAGEPGRGLPGSGAAAAAGALAVGALSAGAWRRSRP